MRNGFLGLRHHTVVCSHDQNHNIGRFRAACPHRRKGFMTGRIKECNHAFRRFDVIGANVLRDAASLASSHFGSTNVVEQRGFAMINVTHNCHHRRARLRHARIGVHWLIDEEGFRVVELGRNRLMAHFFDHDHCSLLIKHLIDGDHLAHLHE